MRQQERKIQREAFSNQTTTIPCKGSVFVGFLTVCPASAHDRGVWRKRGPWNDGPTAKFAKIGHFFVHALLPAGSLDGCASLFVGVRDDVAVYSGGSVGDGSCEGDV